MIPYLPWPGGRGPGAASSLGGSLLQAVHCFWAGAGALERGHLSWPPSHPLFPAVPGVCGEGTGRGAGLRGPAGGCVRGQACRRFKCGGPGCPASPFPSTNFLHSALRLLITFGLGQLQERCVAFIEAHSQVLPTILLPHPSFCSS